MPNMTNAISIKENHSLTQQFEKAMKHWQHFPFVKYPRNEKDYNCLIAFLDILLEKIAGDENHKLVGLVETLSSLISDYEEDHHPAPQVRGIAALEYIMEAHNLRQSDLKEEVGSQGVVSEILHGKRALNTRQIQLLARRFHVDPATFLDVD